MSVEDIQREVDGLSLAERKVLTAWMVDHYPVRSVKDLVSLAEAEALQGKWIPTPPTTENIPSGEAMEKARLRARAIGLIH